LTVDAVSWHAVLATPPLNTVRVRLRLKEVGMERPVFASQVQFTV
jgi:hypothetical protein